MSLLFDVATLRREIVAIRGLAADFLAPGADGVLRQTEQDLIGIAKATDGSYVWCVRPQNPVLTTLSYGNYMPDDEGGLCVHAEVTFKWDLRPVRAQGDSRPAKRIRLDGTASTQIRILEGEPGDRESTELAAWRMEIADDASPGAYFHTQVLGREHDALFPKALDIPRLPGVLSTPFACLEFAVGELFQDRWAQHAVRDSGPNRQWRSVQVGRHVKQLEWHIRQVTARAGSPWASWKKAIPPEELFV